MKFLKLAFVSLVILFLVITGISLLFPSNVRVSKAIDIGTRPDSILMYVRDTSMWPLWHPAFRDQGRQYLQHVKTRRDTSGTVIIEIDRKGNHPAVNGFVTIQSGAADTTVLQWYIDFKLNWYPWEKFSSLFFENTYGLQMQKGLQNIKTLSETGRPSQD